MNTFEHCLLTITAAAAMIAPVCAQITERRATFTGAGGNDGGKCTIEVYVDGTADVEIRGDRGLLRTLSGPPAQWRRFVCSGPLPNNPGEFRFAGIDGRGRQTLIQDPRNARGAAVVRLEDSGGGAEGYTFDLEWRGGSFGPDPTDQPFGGRDRGAWSNDAVRACQDAVRERANRQYGLRDIDFRNVTDDNRGRNDTLMGFFEVRRGNYRDTYQFSCAVDLANGRVRNVDISQGRDAGDADRYAGGDNALSACQREAEQRLQRDGYRNVRFGWANTDNRRNDRIAGTATAQRGNNGRAYDFDFSCSVASDRGNIRSVQVNRR